jgi:hypothetical protein
MAFNAPAAVGAPKAFADHGFDESYIDDVMRAILEVIPADDQRPVAGHRVRRLLQAVWEDARIH